MKRSRGEEHGIHKPYIHRDTNQPQVLGSAMNMSQGYEITEALPFPTQMATGQAFQQ